MLLACLLSQIASMSVIFVVAALLLLPHFDGCFGIPAQTSGSPGTIQVLSTNFLTAEKSASSTEHL